MASAIHDSRRFKVALSLSVLVHATAGFTGVGFGLLHPHRVPEEQVRLLKETAVDRASSGGTLQLVYVEATGPSLQLSASASSGTADESADRTEGPGVVCIAGKGAARPSPLEGIADRAMQPYLDQIRSKLGREIRYVVGQPEGEVLLRFAVDRNGNLKEAGLVPQGTRAAPSLQEEAIRGLKSAAPFPPLPAGWPRETASFTVRLLFQSQGVSGG